MFAFVPAPLSTPYRKRQRSIMRLTCLDPYVCKEMSPRERMQAKWFIMYLFASCAAITLPIALFFEGTDRSYLTFAVFVLKLVVDAVTLVYMMCGGHLLVGVCPVIFCSLVSCLGFDIVSRGNGLYVWPLCVLIVDFMLVLRLPDAYTVIVVVLVVIWLFLMGMEEMLRLGLLDIPGTTVQEGVNGRRAHFESLSQCEKTPCAVGLDKVGSNLVPPVCVFVVDFVATRGFAREVRKEQATMERTINTVQEIASLLAGYDVERVAELLAEHEGQLPEEMTSALRSLEENLRVYKAYLPKTCLPFDVELGEDSSEEASVDTHTESLRSSSHSGSADLVVSRRSPALGLSCVKATLFTINIKVSFATLKDDAASFSQLFTAILLKTLSAVEAKHGMVDVFVGDKIHCSFNTSKKCASHATSSLHAAAVLASAFPSQINMAIATGSVLRGDMGCEVMRRFSMVGALVRDVLGIERAGRAFGCDVLCNRLCFSDAECEHNLRLIPCKVRVAEDSEEDEVVAELLGQISATATVEWMYVVGGKKEWDDYNVAVRQYLKDGTVAKTLDHAEHLHSTILRLSTHSGVLRMYVPSCTEGPDYGLTDA